LRPGRHRCPPAVQQMFQPLLELVSHRPVYPDDAASFGMLAMDTQDTADLAALRDLFTATRAGAHEPDVWTSNDRTRRSTLRILARSAQLHPEAATWVEAVRRSAVYGNQVRADPLLREEGRALVWRGTLLRHHSTGAWRRLWAELVDEVRARASATKDDLYDWISALVPAGTVQQFLADCPATVDRHGDPLPTEDELYRRHNRVTASIAVLLLGGRRRDELDGRSRAAFLGRHPDRKQFLDPNWVAFRHHDHATRPFTELARVFVDDMLAQSQRVALRKLKVDSHGRMTLFSKLQERNGRYYAELAEGSGNVGLRIDQLEFIAAQLSLSGNDSGRLCVTDLGEELLELRT
jgi:hypothetical protein